MKRSKSQDRQIAIRRYHKGEDVSSICLSLGRSKAWFYKWLKHYSASDEKWHEDGSRRPHHSPNRTSDAIEAIVKSIRLSLYNRTLFCGSQAISWEMEDLGIEPLPSLRTIGRILDRNDLTNRRTGRYIPKGVPYPFLAAPKPNDVHQADIVGPLYLEGHFRFYGLNVVDLATRRCATQPIRLCDGASITKAFWDIWWRLGMPWNVQIDNDQSFYGSSLYPRGMGPLIRLCLHNGIQPWFIPPREPWRNGVVEKFNDHYQQRFLDKVTIENESALLRESLRFEQKHNSSYRYSKLHGKTPMMALAEAKSSLRFPKQQDPPSYPLEKPIVGIYNLVRFIRSDGKLNIFSETFDLPQELQHEYVVAKVNVKDQMLQVHHDHTLIEEYEYRLR